MLRRSDKTNVEKKGNAEEENTSKPFAWTPKSSLYYYLEENEFRVNPTTSTDVVEEMQGEGMTRIIREDDEGNDALVDDELDELETGLLYSTGRPRQTFIYETNATDLADSIYGLAVLVAVIAAITVSLVGLTYGLYVLSKKIKGTSEAEYPAYGVTGPSDPQGDSRLAHCAHMFHYEHQKKQIIAMEKGGAPVNRPGSVSEPESDEENEEGDYTVYECPGFATTGDMEVKNPMFSDEPTPATPGKCEIVLPQPKE